MGIEAVNRNNKYVEVVLTIGLILGAAVSGITAYNSYRTNFWKPAVTVVSVDWNNIICQLTIAGEAVTLYGNSVISAGGTWGVQFGTTGVSVNAVYDTVELTNNNMVYSVLATNTSTGTTNTSNPTS